VTSLMQAQNRFIQEQMAYIHHPDLAAMASAQEAYILALTTFLETLGAL
jgi:hypothetical protein